MKGTDRIIARFARILALGALLVVALTTGADAAKGPPNLKGGRSFVLAWNTTSHSVAVSPGGAPWFGTTAPESLSLVTAPAGGAQVVDLDPNNELVTGRTEGETDSLRFDGDGNLWFIRRDDAGQALVRRAPDGTETVINLPGDQDVHSLAIGPEGNIWLAAGYRPQPVISRVTPTGTVTSFPLTAGSYPTSIAAGPDGNIWFIEYGPGRVGRITPSGEIHLFALGPKVEPREIVAGAGGALWFSENGKRGPHNQSIDRIGRITVAGKVTQFPIPFGRGTERLAADPHGPIWFTTQKGEISSISPAGKVGARGCSGGCSPITSLTLAPDGALWFAATKDYRPCLECGGGTALLQQLEGAPVGEIPAGVLKPAGAAR
jgi:virginiamycin B lyase